ncbi:MAG: 3'-5' exonuclease [bacterium]|nr:3'-5' exonuclease [bacterium]
MFLFFDTETTGLPRDWQAPVEDVDNWPRLVQLAWLVSDENGKEVSGNNFIIRPDGFIIPEEASNVHGITTERALAEGVDLAEALTEFGQALAAAKVLVAHNIRFDEKIMGAEFARQAIQNNFFTLPRVCTMQESTDYCGIEGYYGYKWPKLMELHQKLFDESFDGAHDALADVRACAKCFFELMARGVI